MRILELNSPAGGRRRRKATSRTVCHASMALLDGVLKSETYVVPLVLQTITRPPQAPRYGVSMVSVLGIVMMVQGMDFIFEYLDPWSNLLNFLTFVAPKSCQTRLLETSSFLYFRWLSLYQEPCYLGSRYYRAPDCWKPPSTLML